MAVDRQNYACTALWPCDQRCLYTSALLLLLLLIEEQFFRVDWCCLNSLYSNSVSERDGKEKVSVRQLWFITQHGWKEERYLVNSKRQV